MNIDGLTRENVASHLQKYRMMRKKGSQTTTSSEPTGSVGTMAGTAAAASGATGGQPSYA